MKIEKKISFVVAGYEFDNLKTAQFFQRAIRLHKLETESPEACAAFLIDHWNGLLFGGKPPESWTTQQQVVELVQNLQMPKAHIQKKKNIMNHETHEDALLFSPGFKNMDPAPGEQEETEFPTIPGVYGKDDMIG